MNGDTEQPVGMVLAAGRGLRLRPLTDHWAKPVIPFLNRPLIWYALEVLVRAGIRRIGVNAFHHADQVIDAVRRWQVDQGQSDVEFTFAVESELLGTGGGARGIWTGLGSPEITAVVLNGDLVADFDLTACLDAHRDSGQAASLLVSRRGEGRIWLAKDSRRVIGCPGPRGPVRVAEGGSEVSFAGVSILEPEAVRELPRGPGCLFRQGLVVRLLAEGRIGGIASDGVHLDVGTPARYRKAMQRLIDRPPGSRSRPASEPPAGSVLRPPVLIEAATRFDGPVELGPYLVVGGKTRIGAGVRASHGVAYGTRLTGDFRDRIQIGDVALELPE